MRAIAYRGRKYLPVLTRDGRLDARAMVAYGAVGRNEFVLTVYLLCKYEGAGTRGGTAIQNFDIPVYRERVSNVATDAEQSQRLEFMLNIVAVQRDCDYKLRLPISTKKTPAGRTGRKRIVSFGE